MYNVVDKEGKPVLMKDGTPFVYSTQRLAEMGAKHLRLTVPRHRRPLRVVTL